MRVCASGPHGGRAATCQLRATPRTMPSLPGTHHHDTFDSRRTRISPPCSHSKAAVDRRCAPAPGAHTFASSLGRRRSGCSGSSLVPGVVRGSSGSLRAPCGRDARAERRPSRTWHFTPAESSLGACFEQFVCLRSEVHDRGEKCLLCQGASTRSGNVHGKPCRRRYWSGFRSHCF